MVNSRRSFRLGPVESDTEDEWFNEDYTRRLRGTSGGRGSRTYASSTVTRNQPRDNDNGVNNNNDDDNNINNKSVRFADAPVIVESCDEGEGGGGSISSVDREISNQEQQDDNSWGKGKQRDHVDEDTEPSSSSSSSSYYSDEDFPSNVARAAPPAPVSTSSPRDSHEKKETEEPCLEHLGATPCVVSSSTLSSTSRELEEEDRPAEGMNLQSDADSDDDDEDDEEEELGEEDLDTQAQALGSTAPDDSEYTEVEVGDSEVEHLDAFDTTVVQEDAIPGTEVLDDAYWSNDNGNHLHQLPTDSEYESEPAPPRRYSRRNNRSKRWNSSSSARRKKPVDLDSEYEGEDSSFYNSDHLDELDDDDDDKDISATANHEDEDYDIQVLPQENEAQALEALAVAYGDDDDMVYEDADDNLMVGTTDDEGFPDILYSANEDDEADRMLPTSNSTKVLYGAFPDLLDERVNDNNNIHNRDAAEQEPLETTTTYRASVLKGHDPEDPPPRDSGVVGDSSSSKSELMRDVESFSTREITTSETNGDVASTVSFEDNNKQQQQQQRRRYVYMGIGLCLASILLVVILVVLVMEFLVKDGGNTTTTPTNSSTSTAAPSNTMPPVNQDRMPEGFNSSGTVNQTNGGGGVVDDSLFAAIAALSVDGGAAIYQPGTPQNLAFTSVRDEGLPLNQSRLIQRYALRTFFYSTNGPTDWINKTGWETTIDECLWFSQAVEGKPCTANGVYYTLEFDGNGLTGELPPELSLLTGLNSISIKGRDDQIGLTKTIPASLGNLTSLTSFVLQQHNFKKALPENLFDNWSQASVVNIIRCTSPGTLPRLDGLKSVTNFNVGGNRFKGPFPEEMTSLTALKIFNIENNRLDGTLPSTGLENLQILNTFSVAGNFFTGTISSQFGTLTALKRYLDLSWNSFTGTIPSELNKLVNLERLILNRNHFNGSVPKLSGLVKLKELSMEGNDLTGAVTSATCAVLTANAANSTADCNRNGTGEVICSCCTTCCVAIDSYGQCLV